ncbi:hypothetical protein BDN70DRAFT_938538 [Pholiota conissans]|uniref:Uncharacterized protein n=1 Tax=Pholiota conissans TaxID=109636 RepID=A0A9P6CM72_9AGAR|nr:hypothetical protein BDN70DRAFT_938538 [Pholiota conissans]
MADKFVEPMPVDQFFNEFLPVPAEHFVFDDRIHKGLFEEVTKKGTENEISTPSRPFVAHFNSSTPIISLTQALVLSLKKSLCQILHYRPNCGRVGSTDLSTAELTFEFKNNTTNDAFCDTPSEGDEDNFVRTSQSSKQTAGQLTSYAVSHSPSNFVPTYSRFSSSRRMRGSFIGIVQEWS